MKNFLAILLTKLLLISSNYNNKCDKNCALCDNNKLECIKCKNNYSLNYNKCVLNIKNKKNKRNLFRCDAENCKECEYQSSNKCRKCKDGYYLDDFRCIKKPCSEDGTYCSKCEFSKVLMYGKCYSRDCHTIDSKCKLCDENICYQCYFESDFGPNQNCSESDDDKITTILLIIIPIGFVILVICCIICCIKKCKRNNEENNNQINTNINNNRNPIANNNTNNNTNNNNFLIRFFANHNNNIIQNNINFNINSNRILPAQEIMINNNLKSDIINSEDDLIKIEKEFEKQKEELNKEYTFCDYCKFNPGKFKSDCGCILCYEHSKTIKEKPINVCINCDKEVKNIENIDECNICLENKEDLGHFKCGCALKVCKKCYIKIKKIDKKCPGCRGKI